MEPFSRDTHSFLDRSSPYSFSSSEYGSRRSCHPSPPLHPVCPSRPWDRSVDPVRNITPPEDEIPSGREQRAVVKQSKSPYSQACTYIEGFNHRNEPTSGSLDSYEEPLAIKMPMNEWTKLSDDLNIFETDQKYPRYSYNASTSTLIIQCMPSPVHESITCLISEGFSDVRAHLPKAIRANMKIKQNEDFNGFGGRYSGSTKIADLVVEFRNAAGKLEPKFVVEVGFSEKYEDLVQDVKLWLEGTRGVFVVALVKFYETPKYRSPNLDNEEIGQFPDKGEIYNQHFVFEEEYGPVKFRGLTWVGCITEAFIEIWRRDPATGLAFQDGNRMDLFQIPADLSQLQFQLSEFLAVDPQMDRTITFEWEDFKPFLKDQIERLAAYRCVKALKYAQEVADPDYEPSQGSQDS